MVAFYAMAHETSEILSDPRKFRWYATFAEKKNGKEDFYAYQLEPCSEEEFARFYPPVSEQTKKKVEETQARKELFCIDWKALNFPLKGS